MNFPSYSINTVRVRERNYNSYCGARSELKRTQSMHAVVKRTCKQFSISRKSRKVVKCVLPQFYGNRSRNYCGSVVRIKINNRGLVPARIAQGINIFMLGFIITTSVCLWIRSCLFVRLYTLYIKKIVETASRFRYFVRREAKCFLC